MLRRSILLALLCALVLPATSEGAVTIKVGSGKFMEEKYRETLYPRGFRIKGKTGAYRGPVALESDEFPFDGNYARVGEVQTNSKGEYVFPKVAPSRNARLRAYAGTEISKPLSVFVHPGVKVKVRTVDDGLRVRIAFTYLGHPGFAPPEQAIFAYIWINDRGPVRLGGKRRLTQVGDGKWQYAATTDLPSSRRKYRYGLGFCSPGLSAAGYGRTWPIDRACGERSFRE